MEKRNTILLTVIAIATLLVAVVGATFAYFTASTKTSGEGNQSSFKTQNLKGANLTFTNTGEELDMLKYPGGLGIYGATAEIKKVDPSGDANDYKASFDLEITYTNKTGTDLDWELWVIDKKIGELDQFSSGGFAKITTCELKTKVVGNTTYYWYADVADKGEDYQTEQCEAEAIKTAVKAADGKMIAHGKLLHDEGTQDKKITKATNGNEEINLDDVESANSTNNLGDRELSTKTGKDSKVYYLVVKYPNKDQNQATADAGKDISVKLAVNEETASSVLDTSE